MLTGGRGWGKMKPEVKGMRKAFYIAFSILFLLLFAGIWRHSFAGPGVAAAMCLCLAALLGASALKGKALSSKKQLAILAVWTGLLFVLFLCVGLYMSVEPYSDWAALYGGAREYLRLGSLRESREQLLYFRDNSMPLHEYFLIYPHNIFAVLYLSAFFALSSPTLQAGVVLSSLSMALALFFVALAAKKARNFKAALIVMGLGTAFLPFYLNAHRFYTDTLCMPWFSLFIWQWARVLKKENWAVPMAAAGLAVAALLKGNFILCLAAAAFVLPVSKLGFRRSAAFLLSVFLLVFGGGLVSERCGAVDAEKLPEYRLPYVHWVMMSSVGDGGYRQEDLEFSRAAEDKAQATLEEYKARVKSYGSVGEYMRFMYEKLCRGLADGTVTQQNHLRFASLGPLAELILPEGRFYPLFLLYTRALFLSMYVLMLVGSIAGIWKKESGVEFMLYVSFFGMLLFFAFWEFKSRYVLPLMPMYLLLSALSAEFIAEKGKEKWKKFVKLPRRR